MRPHSAHALYMARRPNRICVGLSLDASRKAQGREAGTRDVAPGTPGAKGLERAGARGCSTTSAGSRTKEQTPFFRTVGVYLYAQFLFRRPSFTVLSAASASIPTGVWVRAKLSRPKHRANCLVCPACRFMVSILQCSLSAPTGNESQTATPA